jgi:DNA-directed RNA polymerase subunit D
MKVSTISLTEDTIRFILEGVDVAFANALRRTMVAEVPIMTIDDLFIFDNSSIVADEVLSHRIGLIPLKTDLETYVLPENCDCELELGCPKCRIVLTLDVEATDDNITVYSGDFESEDPVIIPASPGIPLTKLAPGQAVRVEAYAQLGQGKTHTKWSPVSMCVYQNISEIPIEDESKVTECIEALNFAYDSTDTAEIKDGKLRIIDIHRFESNKICRDNISHEAIMDNLIEDSFLFTVESVGSLPPESIVKEAVRILVGKLDELDGRIDRDELHDEISEFDLPAIVESKMYSIGSGDDDEEEEIGDFEE